MGFEEQADKNKANITVTIFIIEKPKSDYLALYRKESSVTIPLSRSKLIRV